MVMTGGVITALAATSSVLSVHWLAGELGDGATNLQLAIPCSLIACLFAFRFYISFTSAGSDPAVYDAEWKPDPSTNDMENTFLRVQLDRQIKLYSLAGATFGFLAGILIA